ncbi:MAG: MerR family transcriptional regulator [Bacteroidota bacterium]
MDSHIDKKYMKIGEAAAIIGVPPSTLRFWEKNFPQVKPMKNKKGDRFYTQKDLDLLKEIHYLSHSKGLKLSSVSKNVKRNEDGITPKAKLVQELREFREKLIKLKEQLE